VDLSLNLVLLVLLACFVAAHLFLRGVAAMFGIPAKPGAGVCSERARDRWRVA